MMRTGLNILWFLLGGWLTAAAWYLAAAVMTLTIVGLPWARACWEIGSLNLHPFGRDIITVAELNGHEDPVAGVFGLIANLVWLPLGLVLAVMHVIHGCALLFTIIGIPLGLQTFKIAAISLAPVGKRVVPNAVADAARARNAAAAVRLRG